MYVKPVWIPLMCECKQNPGVTYHMECVRADLSYPETYLMQCPNCKKAEWKSKLYPYVTWEDEEE